MALEKDLIFTQGTRNGELQRASLHPIHAPVSFYLCSLILPSLLPPRLSPQNLFKHQKQPIVELNSFYFYF
jgi:hypothetical protein